MQIIALKNFDLIAIDGTDTRKFLQGQVTCDIDKLSPVHSLQGAICNIKGRVIADFRLVELNGTCYLQMAEGMADIVKPILDKYMVFSKAESRLAKHEVKRIGIVDAEDSAALHSIFSHLPESNGDVVTADNALLIRIPGLQPRYELWQFAAQACGQNPLPEELLADASESACDRWLLEDIKAGIVHISSSLSEQQLPEALNYDINGVISFTKGCYTGQEIVARMYYRGTAKKRLFSGRCRDQAEQPVSIDCLVPDAQAAVSGEILSKVNDENDEWFLLAILPAAAAEAGVTVYMNGNPQAAIELQSLPYVAD